VIIILSRFMRQAALLLLLSYVATSISTGGVIEDQSSEIKASQQRVLSYVFCWVLLVGVALIAVAFVVSSKTRQSENLDLKEALLSPQFFPRLSDGYYSEPEGSQV
jgi:type II secretory pathway component PulK